MCRQPRLLEHIVGQPALCMSSDPTGTKLWVGAVPDPGPGGRSGLVWGVPGLAVACLEIPCSLVVPPGRHQIAPQSLGWARVCGTENSEFGC